MSSLSPAYASSVLFTEVLRATTTASLSLATERILANHMDTAIDVHVAPRT